MITAAMAHGSRGAARLIASRSDGRRGARPLDSELQHVHEALLLIALARVAERRVERPRSFVVVPPRDRMVAAQARVGIPRSERRLVDAEQELERRVLRRV